MARSMPFDPDDVLSAERSGSESEDDAMPPEHRSYVFDRPTVLAVNAALVTRRPLLVLGSAGSGKSTLAPNVARIMSRPYLEHVITARSESTELFWTFDAVRRLSDAQISMVRPDADYTAAGVLWRAFAPETIAELALGTPSDSLPSDSSAPAVVLLDEIDKADPDLPDALLGPLGTGSFTFGSHQIVCARERAPLVVITSNEERDLSRPFVRRCIVTRLPEPTDDHLVTVARMRFRDDDEEFYRRLALRTMELRAATRDRQRLGPSTAEFLDMIVACRELDLTPEHADWALVERVTLAKTAAEE